MHPIPPALTESTVLKPATVRDVALPMLTVDLNGDDVPATLAIGYPYDPAPGDVVLVIGMPPEYFVIGVIHATNRASLVVDGDLDIAAPTGKIRIASRDGVTIATDHTLTLRARSITEIAHTLTQKLTTFIGSIRGLFQLHSRESRTQVEGVSLENADQKIVRTTKDVKIDGEHIYLG